MNEDSLRHHIVVGHIPKPIYKFEYSNETCRYYSKYQINQINRCFCKNPKLPLEERAKRLHEKFYQDPLLKIYNERRDSNKGQGDKQGDDINE